MNFKIKNILGLMGCALILFSCSKDDGDISTITDPQSYTFTGFTDAIVVPEEAGTYEFEFTFDDRQIYDAHVILSPSSESSATEDADYHLSGHSVDVPTLAGKGSFSVTIDEDFLPEGDETIIMDFLGSGPFNLPESQTSQLITIQNKIYPPAIQVDWNGSFDYAGSSYPICPVADVDMDMFFVDDAGAFAGGFGGATGACPEMMFTDGLTDGNYTIQVNLYGNDFLASLTDPVIDTIPLPMQITFFKGGVIAPEMSTATYNTADFSTVPVWTTYTPSDPDGLMNITVGSMTVSGTEVTLFDPSGAEVGKLD